MNITTDLGDKLRENNIKVLENNRIIPFEFPINDPVPTIIQKFGGTKSARLNIQIQLMESNINRSNYSIIHISQNIYYYTF